MDGLKTEFFITNLDGGKVPFIRISAEVSDLADPSIMDLVQNIIWDAEDRISAALFPEE